MHLFQLFNGGSDSWCKEESSLGDITLVAVQQKGVVPERRDGGRDIGGSEH